MFRRSGPHQFIKVTEVCSATCKVSGPEYLEFPISQEEMKKRLLNLKPSLEWCKVLDALMYAWSNNSPYREFLFERFLFFECSDSL